MQDICRVPSRPANVPNVSRGRRLPGAMSMPPAIGRMAHRVDPPPPPVDRAAWRIRAHAGASPAATPPYSRIAQLRFGTWASPSTSYGCRTRTGFPPACWSPSLSGWLPTTPPQGGSNMAATLAPAPRRHQRNPLITLAATARKADLAPRHYRIPACSPGTLHRTCDVPRRAPQVVTGFTPQTARPTNTTTARTIVSLVRTPPCRASRGSPPEGRSGRSRRPSAAPASRCRDRPPAPPRCGRGPPARRNRRTLSRAQPRSTNVSGPNTAPGRSGPLKRPAHYQRAVALSRTPWSAGTDADPLRVSSTPKRRLRPPVPLRVPRNAFRP